jgi:hypothetical protein
MAGVFRLPAEGPDLPEEFPCYGNSVVPVELCCNLFHGISIALFGIVITVENIRSDLAEIGDSDQGMAGLCVHSADLSFKPVGLAPELADKGEIVYVSLVEGLRQEPLFFHRLQITMRDPEMMCCLFECHHSLLIVFLYI